MVDPQQPTSRTRKREFSKEEYAYLRAEAKAPYRLLRRFIYVAFAGSGFIGALVFLGDIVTSPNPVSVLPNLGLQIGVLALMIWLLKVDRSK